jgi:hypothetical protein
VSIDPSTGAAAVLKEKGAENKPFTFDAVYDEKSEQRDLYDETVRPIVNDVLNGWVPPRTHAHIHTHTRTHTHAHTHTQAL